jgi:hypothetical protein
MKMTNMTAVEWLKEQFLKHELIFDPEIKNFEKYLFEQAIEMEKEQIIDFGVWYSGMEQEKVKKAFERFKNEQI